jgi:hypothetical protein
MKIRTRWVILFLSGMTPRLAAVSDHFFLTFSVQAAPSQILINIVEVIKRN